MAVVPVGAVLFDLEAIGEGFAGFDPVVADARHPIHVRRQNKTVPMNGRVCVQRVGDVDDDVLAFREPQGWPRNAAIYDHRGTVLSRDVDDGIPDRQVIGPRNRAARINAKQGGQTQK